MRLVRLLSILPAFFIVGASLAAALDITEATHANYEAYLRTIGSTKKGAFAVSPDGQYSWYIYCIEANCIPTGIGQMALEKCASLSGKPCNLMAYGREVKIPFTVVPARSSPSEEIRSGILDGDQLKQLVVGNTAEGEYLNAKKWAEYYDPSGEIRGKDDEQGAYTARWTIVAEEMCFDYPGDEADWCAEISMRGNRVDFLDDGEVVTFIRNTILLTGNPNGL